MELEDRPKELQSLAFREVLALVSTGHPEAREELFSRLAGVHSEGLLLLALARRLLPPHDRLRGLVETRDLVQSALLSGWANLADFQGSTPGEFLSWIHTILRRKVGKAIRRLRDRPRVEPMGSGSALESGGGVPTGSSGGFLLRSLIREETRSRVRRAIEGLPASQRGVIQLRIEGLTSAEVAEKLGLDPATVRKRESRALGSLRALLKSWGLEPP